MLVNLEFLKKAQRGHFAIGGFNITALETALAISEAAEELKSPVILQISEKTIDYMGLDLAFTVESIEVMESELKRGGPVYTILESHQLGI